MRRMSRNAAARRPHSRRPWDWRPAGPAGAPSGRRRSAGRSPARSPRRGCARRACRRSSRPGCAPSSRSCRAASRSHGCRGRARAARAPRSRRRSARAFGGAAAALRVGPGARSRAARRERPARPARLSSSTWFALSSSMKRAPGIVAARWRPSSNGTAMSSRACITSVGTRICAAVSVTSTSWNARACAPRLRRSPSAAAARSTSGAARACRRG